MKRHSVRSMGENSKTRLSSAGFSLFELVAFIIISAIIYSVSVNRFREYPAAAERASFQAVLTQLQTGINLEVMMGVSTGSIGNYLELQGINPMDIMLRPPSNYLGVFDSSAAAGLPRRSWYFDAASSELVYLVNSSDGVFLVRDATEIPTTVIKFKVQIMYVDPNSRKSVTLDELNAGADTRDGTGSAVNSARMSGALLHPVVPFKWEGSTLDPNGLVANN